MTEKKIDRQAFLARSSARATAGIATMCSAPVAAAEVSELENLGAVGAMRRGPVAPPAFH